jgi:type IV pilus assembly protein PilA
MTLVELLNVLVIMGILLAIAIPGYLSFKDRTDRSAAQADIRSILPGVQAYGQDNTPNSSNDPDSAVSTTDSGFENMSPTLLQQAYLPSLNTGKYFVTGLSPGTYCIYTWTGPWTASKNGPGNPIQVTLSASFNPATCS